MKSASDAISKPSTHDDQNTSMEALREQNKIQSELIQALQQRISWFEKQLFGPKSEKRPLEDNPHQASLLPSTTASPIEIPKQQIPGYERGKAPKIRAEDCVTDSGLRFSDEVPIHTIEVIPEELTGPDADQYEIIDTKVTHKLAQQPSSYVVLCYKIPVLKKKQSTEFLPMPMLPGVLDRSIADVSFLVGMLVDKFLYHLPLHRQHQRLQQCGITLSRATLTNLTQRSIELLRPIVEAQLKHILQSKVLAMDETPIKAGRKAKGKLKQSYYWPIYGEANEIVFTFSESRGRQHIEQILNKQFKGTLLTDGYAAYARYVASTEGIDHAQCWTHTRRKFIEAEDSHPELAVEMIELIRQLYQVETSLNEKGLQANKKQQYRLEHSKPIIDEIVQWCHKQLAKNLLPKDPLRKAIGYLLNRETELKTFLENPNVAIDTNHLEREIRPIPLGRKNWMFCWTELGAEHVGIIQSLISTCKLHKINPYTYLVDVLQRINEHPASKIEELTPRLWKGKFAQNPMKSVIHPIDNNVLE